MATVLPLHPPDVHPDITCPSLCPWCRVAPTVPPEQVAELLREAEGHTLRFTGALHAATPCTSPRPASPRTTLVRLAATWPLDPPMLCFPAAAIASASRRNGPW
jgi:hypothetical protein